MRPPRPMGTFVSMASGVLLATLFFLPLTRLAWDQWAQTAVAEAFAFFSVLGAILLLAGRAAEQSRMTGALRATGWVWAVFLAASVASSLNSRFPKSAFPASINDFSAFGFFLFAASLSDRVAGVAFRVLAGAGAMGVMGAYLFGTFHSPASGPLVNANLMAALILLTFPIAADIALSKGQGWVVRVLWTVASSLMVWGVAACGSLTGLMAFAVAVMLWMFLQEGNKRRTIPAAILMVVVLAVGGAGVRSEWWKIGGDPDRWSWMTTAVRMFSSHPVWGVGPGAFGEAYPLHRANFWGLNSLYAHNFVLESLAERGLVGGVAWLWLVGYALWRGWKGPKERRGIVVGMTAFVLFNLVQFGFSFPGLHWLFFFAGGLACRGEGGAGGELSKPVLAVGLVGSAALGFVSLALFRSDQFLARSLAVASNPRWSVAKEWVDRGLKWNPWNSSLYELRSSFHVREQRWESALQDMERAVRLSPGSAGLRMELAELFIHRGDLERAVAEYEEATTLLPLKSAAWERKGDLLSMAGRRNEAGRAYENAERALRDPRVLAGNPSAREEAVSRLAEKKRGRSSVPKPSI